MSIRYRHVRLIDRDIVDFVEIVNDNNVLIVNDLINLAIYPGNSTRLEREQINRVYIHYIYTSILKLTACMSRDSILLHVHTDSLKRVELSQWFETKLCFCKFTIEQLLPDLLKNIGINHIISATSYDDFISGTMTRGEDIDLVRGAQNRRTTSLRHFKKFLSNKGLTQLETTVSENINIHRMLS